MSTVKIYDDFPYQVSFNAHITDITPLNGKEYTYLIVSDCTAFFPESGGQSCDRGYMFIGEKKGEVEKVSIDDCGIITHRVKFNEELKLENIPGTSVLCEIDREHRFSNMQQHTGEHIFSGLVNKKYGYDNVGFHLSDNTVTMDYNGFLNADEVALLEYEANEAIAKNLEVNCYYPEKSELSSINYRCKAELDGNIRIVEINGIDICACCCPHVRRTGEVGILKVVSSIRYKGGTRLSILCGFRALAYFNSLSAEISSLKNLLSAEQSELSNSVLLLRNERDSLRTELNELHKVRLMEMVDALPPDAPSILFTSGVNAKAMREALNYFMSTTDGYSAIFDGDDKKGYSYLIGSNSLDSVSVCKALTEHFGAKGGGKKEMVQGFVDAGKADILNLLSSFSFQSALK